MQVVFTNECKSCKTSNQMFFTVVFSFLKTKNKMKLFSDTILYGVSNEPQAYLEPS